LDISPQVMGPGLITSLDVTSNTALKHLDCGSNELTSLDIAHNAALTSLSCSGNPLMSLDVSNNTALTSLECSYNQLTSLDVSNNTALTELSCSGNLLTCLDIRNNTSIIVLHVGYMPSLEYVCIWTNPSFHATVEVGRWGSPHVYFSTDSTDCQMSTSVSSEEFSIASIYPNPAIDQLTLEFGEHPGSKTSVILFDITGKEVYSEILDNTNRQTHTFNLASLRKGLYFIRISSDEYSITERVIKVE
jgi:Leucine-rich repeat (LRR) protein